MSEIMVSIVCNTYNQEAYIRNALDGFLMQETTFDYEVLVHDDASTDGTRQIIEEYTQKYPNLIKPILQTENQFSQRISITRTFQFPRAQGKYIAFCEGDDYWTDPTKQQTQVDALEAHPDIDLCGHRVRITENEVDVGLYPVFDKDCIFTAGEAIKGGGGFVPTGSMMFRKEIIGKYTFAKSMSLDYVWQISGSLRGGLLYLADCMGVYRRNANGSWTVFASKNPERQIRRWGRLCEMLEALKEETNGKYEDEINSRIAKMRLNIWNWSGALNKTLSREGRAYLRYQSPKDRVIIVLQTARRSLMKLVKR